MIKTIEITTFTRRLRGGLIVMAAVLGAMALQAQYANPGLAQNTKASFRSSTFIKKAAQAHLAEAQVVQVGSQKAQNPDLKHFCAQMRKDHPAAYDKLLPIAQAEGVTLPSKLGWGNRYIVRKLDKMSGGPDFDKYLAT